MGILGGRCEGVFVTQDIRFLIIGNFYSQYWEVCLEGLKYGNLFLLLEIEKIIILGSLILC